MSVLAILLTDLPVGWRVTHLYVGQHWILSLVEHDNGSRCAGVAAAPKVFPYNPSYGMGRYTPESDVAPIANLLRSEDSTAAAVGLATLNAIQQPQKDALTNVDAADWLSEQCKDRTIAIFGRFPFIEDEVRPFAKQVFVFEQTPSTGEYGAEDRARLLPQADIIAITGSTIINHTIDNILAHIPPQKTVIMLGPSTPLTERLFAAGIDVLFGVRVANCEAAAASALEGQGFQKMRGLERVALFR